LAAITCSRAAAFGADLAADLLGLRLQLGLLDLLFLEVERVLHLLAGELLGEQRLHSPAVVGRQVDLADLARAQDDAVGARRGFSSASICAWISARLVEKISRTV
jgi:hypothetical protein